MKIKPIWSYEMTGTRIKVDSTKVYSALPATNQPEWEKRSAVFLLCDWDGSPKGDSPDAEESDCYSMLLIDGEYEIVEGNE